MLYSTIVQRDETGFNSIYNKAREFEMENALEAIIACKFNQRKVEKVLNLVRIYQNTLNIESSELQSELIVVPTAIIATPFVVKALPIGFSVALSLFLVIVYLVSVKGRIMYSNTEKSFLAMPIELISVGIVYMILSFF